jgi:hypothetical protein
VTVPLGLIVAGSGVLPNKDPPGDSLSGVPSFTAATISLPAVETLASFGFSISSEKRIVCPFLKGEGLAVNLFRLSSAAKALSATKESENNTTIAAIRMVGKVFPIIFTVLPSSYV